MKHTFLVGVLAATVGLACAAPVVAQTQTTTALGTVRLNRKLMANGQPLPPGSYTMRLTTEEGQPAAGQTGGAEKWVEFLKGGKVVGREMAVVIPESDIAQIAKSPKPAKGGVRVDTLKGNDFVRVWIRKNGYNYLLNMPPA